MKMLTDDGASIEAFSRTNPFGSISGLPQGRNVAHVINEKGTLTIDSFEVGGALPGSTTELTIASSPSSQTQAPSTSSAHSQSSVESTFVSEQTSQPPSTEPATSVVETRPPLPESTTSGPSLSVRWADLLKLVSKTLKIP